MAFIRGKGYYLASHRIGLGGLLRHCAINHILEEGWQKKKSLVGVRLRDVCSYLHEGRISVRSQLLSSIDSSLFVASLFSLFLGDPRMLLRAMFLFK
jgi:hypothetical protein